MGVSRSVALRISKGAFRKYKVFTIAKRNSLERRLVAQPAREVKALQRSVVKILMHHLPIHAAATAYQFGSSIKANAEIHKNAKYLLKLDFYDFFPSISRSALGQHLVRYCAGISAAEIDFVQRASLWQKEPGSQFGLCIGAPSSPFLSNTVMYDFDVAVAEVCARQEIGYSRYSDDLTFSSLRPSVLIEIESQVKEILAKLVYPTLQFNDGKRINLSRKIAMNVTGLTLSNQGVVTVGRRRKRGVRAGVANYLKGQVTEAEYMRLRGELAFVLSIEPEYSRVLLSTYGDQVRHLLPKPGSKTGET